MKLAAVVVAAVVLAWTGGAAAQERPGSGVTLPKVVKEVKPHYPREVMDERVQGSVTLDMVVSADGTVGKVTVAKALHPKLDESAIIAAKQWLFTPGEKGGKPVDVQITLEMTFTLK